MFVNTRPGSRLSVKKACTDFNDTNVPDIIGFCEFIKFGDLGAAADATRGHIVYFVEKFMLGLACVNFKL